MSFSPSDLGYLVAGNYTLALTEYDNSALGSLLSEGFVYDGQGNFTSAGGFWEANIDAGVQRSNAWTVNFSNVSAANLPVTPVPEPATGALLLLGLTPVVGLRRRRAV